MRTETRTIDAVDRVPTNRYWCFGLLASFGLAADLLSKHVVFDRLGYPDGQTGWLIDTVPVQFRLYTSFNEGALWGMGKGFALVFALLSIIAFAGVLYWLFVRRGAVSLWLTIALSVITAGTLGNFYDRLGLHGVLRSDVFPTNSTDPLLAVRDFLHFRFFETFDWAIFNVADMLLVTGAIMLVIQSFRADAIVDTEHTSPGIPSNDTGVAAVA